MKARIGVVKSTPQVMESGMELNFRTGQHEFVEKEHPETEFPYRLYMCGGTEAGSVYFESTTRFQTEESALENAQAFIACILETLGEVDA